MTLSGSLDYEQSICFMKRSHTSNPLQYLTHKLNCSSLNERTLSHISEYLPHFLISLGIHFTTEWEIMLRI